MHIELTGILPSNTLNFIIYLYVIIFSAVADNLKSDFEISHLENSQDISKSLTLLFLRS